MDNATPAAITKPAGQSQPQSASLSPSVLALIPGYQEEARIGAVVSQAAAHLPVLVVDDGSRDATAARAEAAGAQVLRQSPNQGKGAALRAGFRWALERDFAAVITLDADGQHDPAEIPHFLAAFHAGNHVIGSSVLAPIDLVIGARDFRLMPLVRRVSNTVGERLFSWALGQPSQDNQSGYRLISRRLMAVLLESDEQGFEFEVEMIVTCVRRGFGLAWVPIRTIYGDEESHIRPVAHVVNFSRVIWRTRRTR